MKNTSVYFKFLHICTSGVCWLVSPAVKPSSSPATPGGSSATRICRQSCIWICLSFAGQLASQTCELQSPELYHREVDVFSVFVHMPPCLYQQLLQWHYIVSHPLAHRGFLDNCIFLYNAYRAILASLYLTTPSKVYDVLQKLLISPYLRFIWSPGLRKCNLTGEGLWGTGEG